MSAPALVGQALAIVLASGAGAAFFLVARFLSPDSKAWRNARLPVVWTLDGVGIFWGIAALTAVARPSIVGPATLALAALFAVLGVLLLGHVGWAARAKSRPNAVRAQSTNQEERR